MEMETTRLKIIALTPEQLENIVDQSIRIRKGIQLLL